MSKRVSIWLWILSFFLTLLIASYQRLTGPTHPARGRQAVVDGEVSWRFLRSHIAHTPLPVEIRQVPTLLTAELLHRRYPGGGDWRRVEMQRKGENLVAAVPGEAPAGKVEYRVCLHTPQGDRYLPAQRPVVARFRGEVPLWLLIPHVLAMFLGMLLALRTGFAALHRDGAPGRLVAATLVVLFLGGIVLGPLVQKYAFGKLWTGFPLGSDLTDNKTLAIFLFWVAAYFLRRKSRWWVAAAAALMILVYLIPHSVLGSELDYRSGKMTNVYSALPPLRIPPVG